MQTVVAESSETRITDQSAPYRCLWDWDRAIVISSFKPMDDKAMAELKDRWFSIRAMSYPDDTSLCVLELGAEDATRYLSILSRSGSIYLRFNRHDMTSALKSITDTRLYYFVNSRVEAGAILIWPIP